VTASRLAVVDTGPVLAAADQFDADHARSRLVFERPDLRLVFPAMVIAEASYLLGQRFGPEVEARFLSSLAEAEVEAPLPDDWSRIAELVSLYADFPLGGIDASVVALAERLNTDLVVTLDHRHFRAIRPRHVPTFRLLPE
jgi:predicted nucleic acid-binding protein